LDALVLIGSHEAAEALASGTRSPFQEDTHGVAEALAALGDAALDTLRRLTRSSWWEERRAAAIALVHWRGCRQTAVDMALPMTVDTEYRVAEAAREALLRHGLQPGADSVAETLRRVTPITLASIEPWLGLDAAGRFEDPTAGAAFDAHLKGLASDDLTHRLPLAGRLRRHGLRPWMTELASGAATSHVGLRLAATATLRALDNDDCSLCNGRRTSPCVGCNGDGETRCEVCLGEATTRTPCPEHKCTARERTRGIRSPTCKTCRGRGVVVHPCGCANGFVPCVVCHGGGRALCLGCNGSGKQGGPQEAPGPDDGE
ncbi:MAG: hypothetical protein QF464_18890, partial [Myxococcota bacterium]|nr:hypothetical protein [Myxococcota bacterium]